MADEYVIAKAQRAHLDALPGIERAAAVLFPREDLSPKALATTTSHDELALACEEARLFVALGPDGAPVGFALADELDDEAHLEELDVHPDHGRRGLGRRLVEAVVAWAANEGWPSISLTTFRHLPFNAPFYARLGFEEIPPAALTPELRDILDEEARSGLDPRRRVAMRRRLGG